MEGAHEEGAPAAGSAHAVLSEPALVQLRGLPAEVRGELLELYFAEAAAQLNAIATAAESGDGGAIAADAHNLRGSSLIVAAQLVATLAGELEITARAGELSDAVAAVRALRIALEETRVALDAAFADHAVAAARNST
ncbi:MAG: Hpt domain-containing protein [Solirubrobacteraceae bacterium]